MVLRLGGALRGMSDKPNRIDEDGRSSIALLKKHNEIWGSTSHQRLLTFWSALYFGNPYVLDPELFAFEDDVYSTEESDEYTQTIRPLMKRRPNVRACEGRKLINRQTSMLVGRGRFPQMWIEGIDKVRITESTRQFEEVLEKAKFRAMMRSAIRWMCIEGSAAATFNAIPKAGGRIYPVVYPARECLPEFGWDSPEEAEKYSIEPDDLTKLTVTRVYKTAPDSLDVGSEDGKWMVHRRVFTPMEIIDYEPIEMRGDIHSLVSMMEVRKTDKHGLGFVPAVWLRNSDVDENPWGTSLFDGIESMLMKVDYGMSQEWRAGMYHGDPALCPEDAESANMMPTGNKMDKGAPRTLPIPMKFLEIDGKGQEVQRTIRKDTQHQIQQVTGLHIHDPADASGTVSGKALEFRYEPTVNQTLEVREVIEHVMIDMARKIFVACMKRGIISAPSDLPSNSGLWRVGLNWPPIYDRTAADYQEGGQAILTLRTAEVIDRKTAFAVLNEMLGGKFDETVVMKALEEERKEEQQRERASVTNQEIRDAAGE